MSIEASANLCCHPTTPCEEVRVIHVRLRRTNAELELNFQLEGNISRLCLLPPSGHQDRVELWRRTCFEVFVGVEGQAAYHEFNFAPSRQWRAHAFRAYRDPVPLTNQFRALTVATMATSERLKLGARLVLADLSPVHSHAPLRLGLSAVIERVDRLLSFWALYHSGAKPDFHHPDAFALRLEAPQPDRKRSVVDVSGRV